jgi:hypothetical protein
MTKGTTKLKRVLLRGGLAIVVTAGAAAAVEMGTGHANASSMTACPATATGTAGDGPAMKVTDGEIHLAIPTATDDATLELTTTAVHRGSTALDMTVVDTTLTGPETITTIRKGLVESAQRITAGVEQSWCFVQAPHGSGDLVVRVTSYVTTSKRGGIVPAYPGFEAANGSAPEGIPLHYPDLVDAMYHHGTWIDANGQRSPVTARFVDSAIELTVPAKVLAASTFPATLDPIIVVTPLPG